MTAELRSAEPVLRDALGVDVVAGSSMGATPDVVSMVETVAKVVSGISVIGEARKALSAGGWTARITANRVTIDDDVIAQLVPAKTGAFGLVSARWVVYSIAGVHPVWIVGAE